MTYIYCELAGANYLAIHPSHNIMKCHFGSNASVVVGVVPSWWCMGIVTLLKWVIHSQQNDTFIPQYTILFPINQSHPPTGENFLTRIYYALPYEETMQTGPDCVSELMCFKTRRVIIIIFHFFLSSWVSLQRTRMDNEGLLLYIYSLPNSITRPSSDIIGVPLKYPTFPVWPFLFGDSLESTKISVPLGM